MWSDTPCWDWQGPSFHNPGGYGRYNGRYAHRGAYEAWHGPIPKGAVVMHLCERPSCMNPLHLKAGTQRENMRMSEAAMAALDEGRKKAWASLPQRNRALRPPRWCSVAGCDRRHYGLDLCSMHYKRLKAGTL